MPTCGGCQQPCNCVVTEDGVFGGLTITDSGISGPGVAAGRRNTVVTGGGFDVDNPYVLQFQHSEFYRPPTFEVRVPTISLANNVVFPIELENYEHSFLYETPEHGLLIPPEFAQDLDLNEQTFGIHFGKYNLIGASCVFPPAASGFFQLNVAATYHDSEGLSVVGAYKVDASAGSSRYASCWGVAPSDFFRENVNQLWVDMKQTTGATINVTNFKFWLTTV